MQTATGKKALEKWGPWLVKTLHYESLEFCQWKWEHHQSIKVTKYAKYQLSHDK